MFVDECDLLVCKMGFQAEFELASSDAVGFLFVVDEDYSGDGPVIRAFDGVELSIAVGGVIPFVGSCVLEEAIGDDVIQL